MARKILLDIDPGFADALALCLAVGDPRLDVVAVTATGGNVRPQQATRNVQAIVERLDPSHWPRIGSADPDQMLRTDGRSLCGEDGFCGAGITGADLHHQRPSTKVIADEIRAAPGDLTIIAGGPLTNLAALFQLDPELAMQTRHLIIVGGTYLGPGNVTAAAEFNFYCDAEAAKFVFHLPITKTLLPLDVASQAVLQFDYYHQLPEEDTQTGKLLRKILGAAYRACRQKLGQEGLVVPEAIAVAAALHPELITTERMYGDVEVAGDLTHAATVFDRRPNASAQPNLDVAIDLDSAGAIDCLTRSLQQAG